MIKKLFLNQAEKVKTGSWLLNRDKASKFFFYLLILFLPTQLGKHFWPNSSFVYGLRLDYLSPTLYLTDIFILFIFLFSLPQIIKYLKKESKTKILIFILFILSICVGIQNSKNPPAGWYGFIKFLEFSFLTLYTYLNFKKLNSGIIFFASLIAVSFEAILCFLQYLSQGSIGGIFYIFGERSFNAGTPGIANASVNGQLILRPYATFPHPNVLSAFLIIFMLLLLLFYRKVSHGKFFLFSGIILGTTSLFLTLSRVSIMLWGVFLIYLFGSSVFEKYKKKKISKKSLIIISGIVLLAAGFYLMFINTNVLGRIALTKLTDESLVQRKELIEQSLGMFYKNPVFGVGINNFFNNLNFIKFSVTPLLIQPVHNIFLLVLSETGIIGAVGFLYLFSAGFASLVKKGLKNSKYLLMIFLTILALGVFDHYFLTIQQGQILLCLSFGAILAKSK